MTSEYDSLKSIMVVGEHNYKRRPTDLNIFFLGGGDMAWRINALTTGTVASNPGPHEY